MSEFKTTKQTTITPTNILDLSDPASVERLARAIVSVYFEHPDMWELDSAWVAAALLAALRDAP